jgi:uncharacterized protein (TIGR00255 family)
VLLSMTGIGEGRVERDELSISVELRSVNNRHLKVSLRGPEAYLQLEHDIEKVIRGRIGRGTVSVQLRVDRRDGGGNSIDVDALRGYVLKLRRAAAELQIAEPADLGPFLALPGVVSEGGASLLSHDEWPLVEQVLGQALDRLQEFRTREGASMAQELSQLCGSMESQLVEITGRAPLVVEEYRQRLRDRINEALREAGVTVNDADLIREVGLFADRSDINEEITRLRCHIEQFRVLIDGSESTGRTMEFLCQEMNREINTIGSKANDVEIARRVVETKGAIERIREIVQNVE